MLLTSLRYWLPRVLGIGIVGYSAYETILAWNNLLNFNLLSIVVTLYVFIPMLVIAWKWKIIGTLMYVVLGLLCLIFSYGESKLIISGLVLLVTGVLFYFGPKERQTTVETAS